MNEQAAYLPVDDADDASIGFLFQEDGTDRLAIIKDANRLDLLTSESGWSFVRKFVLGVHHPMPVPMDPEPVLRGIVARGFYSWNAGNVPKASGTGQ